MVVPSKAWPKVWASAAHVRPRLTVDTPRTLLIAAIRAFSEVRHIAAYRRLRRHSAVEAVGGRSVAFAIAATGCLDGSAHTSRRQSKASRPTSARLLAAGRCSSPALGIATAAKDHRTAMVRNSL